MQSLYDAGYQEVAKALDEKHQLYSGAELTGHALNSNSVWNTALKSKGIHDVDKYDGWLSSPGNNIDLRTEPTNNKWFGKENDRWKPNPKPSEPPVQPGQQKDALDQSYNDLLTNIFVQLKSSGMSENPQALSANNFVPPNLDMQRASSEIRNY